ncbi:MAG: hypothetical protein ABR569_09370 [Gaiellaceae bacterium]
MRKLLTLVALAGFAAVLGAYQPAGPKTGNAGHHVGNTLGFSDGR